jgi:DNA-binding protein HU-beta
MTKAEIIEQIVANTGIEKPTVTATVEALMSTIKQSMANGENVYLRGFGTFMLKRRAEKIARDISKGTTVKVPAHYIPKFKPNREFMRAVKAKVKYPF